MTVEAQPAASDADLVAALRAGDEAAFRRLVQQHHPAMVRVARSYLRSPAVAEEVVQETWLAVVEGIDRFEGRSSLKTWLYRILVNRALSRSVREQRSVPVADIPDVDPSRFRGGVWADPPDPALAFAGEETRRVVVSAIEGLPDQQRQVIALRDVEGCSAEEVCEVLDLTMGNQRVLLHRARSRVRAALERHARESSS